jgi:hypothetical protein
MLALLAIAAFAALFITVVLLIRSDRGQASQQPNRRAPIAVPWETRPTERGLALELPGSITLTLIGDADGPASLEQLLRATMGQRFIERSGALAVAMSRANVECPEVEAWRVKSLAAADRLLRKKLKEEIAADPEFLEDFDGDEQAALDSLYGDAADELPECASHWIGRDLLRVPRPESLASDDVLLDHVQDRPEAVYALFRLADRIGRGFRPSKWDWMPGIDALIEAGAARRGTDLPPEAVIEATKMADLRAALPEGVKIRRKADALPHLTEQVIERLPGLEEVVFIDPLPDQVAAALPAWRWSSVHAQLLLETIVCAERVAATLEEPLGEGDEWAISGDCCKRSRAAAERDSSRRKPKALPPFHVGCQAELEVW